jgi:streptomycin 6-kinase
MPSLPPIPQDFELRMIELNGDPGKRWLASLPQLIIACQQRWSLDLSSPFPLSYNYVIPAVSSTGQQVVLKLGFPNPELHTEIAALRVYNGRGAVQLLDVDPENGILLLERLIPGTSLLQLHDDPLATSITAQVMRDLWRPVPADHSFPSVAKWSDGFKRLRDCFGGGCGPFPTELVEMAEALFAELLPSMSEQVLLHGDLHHENILSAQRRPWLAIDPKGVIGEPAYETGALLRNPLLDILDAANPVRLQRRRVDQFSEELDLDRQRILGWGIAQAVLSACLVELRGSWSWLGACT